MSFEPSLQLHSCGFYKPDYRFSICDSRFVKRFRHKENNCGICCLCMEASTNLRVPPLSAGSLAQVAGSWLTCPLLTIHMF